MKTVLKGEPKVYKKKLKMLEIFLFVILLLVFYNNFKNRKLYAAARKFPGPKAYPLLGNSLDFASGTNGIFSTFNEFSQKYDRFFRIWNNGKLYVICTKYKDAEILLSNPSELRKTDLYKFFYPWIGQGLISNSVISNWRKHRKIITPTFHFKILHNFLDVFNRNAEIFCDEMEAKVGKGPFDVATYVKLMALDNICETAMGINMNAQKNSESEYVKAVKDMTNVLALRFFKVWLMIDFLFYMSKYATIQKKALKIIHGTTSRVIQERKQQLQEQKQNLHDTEEDVYEKKKLAFLDLLLGSEEGSQLSDRELREETDTFMFAGHDTISSTISFALYCLADNPEIQEKAYKEQLEIFGESKRSPTHTEIQEMKYLDRVMKEIQRLYPTVPIIGRDLSEDIRLPGDYTVPKGAQMVINIYSLHHDPEVWPDPEKFDPDRFLPEATTSRSPYAYVPFSAGPRNCIGQKYAILAMKSTFSIILRRFKILPSPYPKDRPVLAAEVVLVSINGTHIQLEARN